MKTPLIPNPPVLWTLSSWAAWRVASAAGAGWLRCTQHGVHQGKSRGSLAL